MKLNILDFDLTVVLQEAADTLSLDYQFHSSMLHLPGTAVNKLQSQETCSSTDLD